MRVLWAKHLVLEPLSPHHPHKQTKVTIEKINKKIKKIKGKKERKKENGNLVLLLSARPRVCCRSEPWVLLFGSKAQLAYEFRMEFCM